MRKLKHLKEGFLKIKTMGGNLSFAARPEDVIEDIDYSDRFIEYQKKFEALSPPRELYFNERAVVIETQIFNSYSISNLEFNWSKPDVREQLYEYLDKTYDVYKNTEKITQDKSESDRSESDSNDRSDVSDSDKSDNDGSDSDKSDNDGSEPNIRNEIVKHIQESIDTDIEDWNIWLDTYFEIGSLGHQLLLFMEETTPSEVIGTGEILIYPPQYIWFSTLQNMMSSGIIGVRPTIKDRVKELYLEAYDILDGDESIVVIIAKTEEGWKYVGLTTECVDNMYNIYEQQTY